MTASHSCADAAVAFNRIGAFLTAEELADPYLIDANNEHAIDVDGDFQWESSYKSNTGTKFEDDKKKEHKDTKKHKKDDEPILPTTTSSIDEKFLDAEPAKDEEKPFELKGLNLKIPKGSFVAIVGRVGSGKVQSFVEMKINVLFLTDGLTEFAFASLDWRDAQNGRSRKSSRHICFLDCSTHDMCFSVLSLLPLHMCHNLLGS